LACIVWYLGSNSPLPHAEKPQPGTAEFQALSEEEQLKITEDRSLYPQLQGRVSEDFQNLPTEEQDQLKKVDKDFADRLFGRAAYDILPQIGPGLVGLLLASLLAAIMSTSDAQMVVSSGLFTENIYKRYMVKNKSERHYLWVGRLSGLFIVLLAIVLQTTFEDVIQALQYILDTPAIIGISLWIGIVWRGWTPAAVWVSTISGGIAWAACMFFPNQLQEWGLSESMFHTNGKMLHLWRIVFYLSAGLFSGLITSFLTKRVDEKKLDHFFRVIHTPVKPGEVVDEPCTLPKDPLPPAGKLFNLKDIEIGKPTLVGMGGFIASWICVGLIIWLTWLLARVL
ncbi:MAG: hypothetical protein KDA84_27210, partial [Planctomycetaceae bacterium]|nr:hypothetical protein [Planctomycetaceae bacterium]